MSTVIKFESKWRDQVIHVEALIECEPCVEIAEGSIEIDGVFDDRSGNPVYVPPEFITELIEQALFIVNAEDLDEDEPEEQSHDWLNLIGGATRRLTNKEGL